MTRLEGMVEPEDGAGLNWFGDMGLRSIDIIPLLKFRPSISPYRPFSGHLAILLKVIKQAGESKDCGDRVFVCLFLLPQVYVTGFEAFPNHKARTGR
jgi:hypothetical protein